MGGGRDVSAGPVADWRLNDADPEDLQSISEQEASLSQFERENCWWACHHPERPFTRYTVMHDRCGKCLIATEAAVAAGLALPRVSETMRARLDEHGEAAK